MATRQERQRAARSTARAHRAGKKVLPPKIFQRARETVVFYESHKTSLESVPIGDQKWVAKMIKRGWWDNGKALQDRRYTGPAEDVYNFITQPNEHWDTIKTNNVIYVGNGNFSYYAARVS